MLFFFYILFQRNIPAIFSDVVVVIVVGIVVGIVVVIFVGIVVGIVVVPNTVAGVFPFFFKLMILSIVIPNIIRRTRILKTITRIVFLLRECSDLEQTRSFLLFTIIYNTHTMFLAEYLIFVLIENRLAQTKIVKGNTDYFSFYFS